VIALQSVEDPADRRRSGTAAGRLMRLTVFAGTLDQGGLSLRSMAADRKQNFGDKRLDAVLARSS
jgi:hypothetical protein